MSFSSEGTREPTELLRTLAESTVGLRTSAGLLIEGAEAHGRRDVKACVRGTSPSTPLNSHLQCESGREQKHG